MWFLPLLIVGLSVTLSVPLGRYMAWCLDRPSSQGRLERYLDTGPQNWKAYCLSLLGFNLLVFLMGFGILVAQPWLPSTQITRACSPPPPFSIPPAPF